jgi:hypothetical protein
MFFLPSEAIEQQPVNYMEAGGCFIAFALIGSVPSG